MTAPVIAEEHDEYAEHVANVAATLASRFKLRGQTELSRDDVAQVMAIKGVRYRDTVHSQGCDWRVIPAGHPACCGLMTTALWNAATTAVNAARTRQDRLPTTSLEEWQPPPGDDSDMAYAEVMSAMERVLTSVERNIVLLRGQDGYTWREIAELLNIPKSTVSDRFLKSRLRILEHLSD